MTTTKLIKALLIGASQFLRGTRAGATAISAVAVIIMTIGGTALISDHLWLVNNRDILKVAADAGAVAATMRLRRFPNSTQEELQAITERYIWINLKSNTNDPSLKQSDVRTVLNLNRTMGLVDVKLDAPIGKPLLSRIVGYDGPGEITVRSGADSGSGPVWVVLALDQSRSMSSGLDGRNADTPEESRMGIVKAAAKDFVEEVLAVVVTVNGESLRPISVGVVPWSRGAYGSLTPTRSKVTIDGVLDRIEPIGRATASSRGMKKSRELLALAPEGASRVIVLLTDGQDNVDVNGTICGNRDVCPMWRAAECTSAKNEGVTIFTIGAMRNTEGNLAQQLRDCASSESYAFINTADVQEMYDTFDKIAGQLRPMRRTY